MPKHGARAGRGALTLRGRLVCLRPVADGDLVHLRDWQNDREIARWMDYRAAFTLEAVRADVERSAREGVVFTIERDGRPVGKCGLHQFRRVARACTLFVYVGERSIWGRGTGTDAVATLVRHAFEDLGMRRVELSVLSGNDRARRVYEACGFVRTSTLRSGRGSTDEVIDVMSVDRAGFEGAGATRAYASEGRRARRAPERA